MDKFVIKNKLQKFLMEYDPEQIEVTHPLKTPEQKTYKYTIRKDFKEKTGMHHNRFQKLFKNPEEEFTQSELAIIARYFSKLLGKKITMEDLIEEIIEE